jgi:uncharacterized protein (DUF1697 family)
MERLRALFHSLGFSGIRTCIQTGNVFFQSEVTKGALLHALMERAVRKALGYDAVAFLRTRAVL